MIWNCYICLASNPPSWKLHYRFFSLCFFFLFHSMPSSPSCSLPAILISFIFLLCIYIKTIRRAHFSAEHVFLLLVSVPGSSMFTIVTVRCGHCANLLSVNMGGLLQSVHHPDFQKQQPISEAAIKDSGSSSKCNRFGPLQAEHEQPKMPPIRPPEKRQRVPSAYNRFIKEEIQRIKASNPEINHREAFSTAAKNWAHLPHIQFGLNKQAKIGHADAGEEGTQKSLGFY